MSGLISDVRLIGVTTEGVNLEVMVLEQIAEVTPVKAIPVSTPDGTEQVVAKP